MDAKELGLVAAQQLFQLKELHYGFWEKGEKPTVSKFPHAQERYTEFLIQHINQALGDKREGRILDVGCGVGHTMYELLKIGYRVDGIVPYPWMAKMAEENARRIDPDGTKAKVYECRFEELPVSNVREKYELIFFSESYQYIPMQESFELMRELLSTDGKVVIFDFFTREGARKKSKIRGGHTLVKFYDLVTRNGYEVNTDIDVTEHLSPNLTLANDILIDRIGPVTDTVDRFLGEKYRITYNLGKFLLRKRLEKVKSKYLSENRNETDFIKHKTYRLIVLDRARQQS